MPFRPYFPAPAACLSLLALLGAGISHAEDPFLGQIRAIKCVNCKPGWVTLGVHDPIETRDFELYLKDTDYNKIVTPLPGKRIHDKNGECFYWLEKPKAAKSPKAAEAQAPATDPGAGKPAAKGSAKNSGAAGPAIPPAASPTDSTQLLAGMGREPSFLPPPSPELQGTPSDCIRFYRVMK